MATNKKAKAKMMGNKVKPGMKAKDKKSKAC